MSSADPPFSSIRYLATSEAYDRWAAVYDTDGNFLQKLDTMEMKTLFPRFIASLPEPARRPRRIVDLGCGTGRNTALLLAVPDTEIVALDASQGMLDVARSRLLPRTGEEGPEPGKETWTGKGEGAARPNLHFALHDIIATSSPPEIARDADGVISTLVVEHVPLRVFFAHAAALLRPGGALLLTNMHADMGAVSQAGFVDAATGEKIRPTSYAHTVADVVAEAGRWGLRVEGGDGIREVAVDEDMIDALGPRSQKWVGVTCWFGGIFIKDA
ncbi:hypothetical protein DL767_000564 [Monosporascus sp. MG133]|nr:hypothetical protein DL767_000564 [Monosporascus sp. MG133]